MNELKQQYNNLLKRYKKAEKFYSENTETTSGQEEAFLKIVRDMSCILNELDRMGIKYTDNEVLEGFEC